MCKQLLQGLLGGAKKGDAPLPARVVENTAVGTGANVLDTSVGEGESVAVGREGSGRVRLSGANSRKIKNGSGLSL